MTLLTRLPAHHLDLQNQNMTLEGPLAVIQSSPLLRARPTWIRFRAFSSWLLRSHLQGWRFHSPIRYLLQYLNALLGGGSFCISNWNFPCLNSCQNISHRIASFIPPLDQSISSEVHKNLLSHAWIKYTSCITEELHKLQASQHGSCRVVRPTRTIAKLLFQNGTGLFCHQ